jgi:hypothetical protein
MPDVNPKSNDRPGKEPQDRAPPDQFAALNVWHERPALLKLED